MPPVTFRPDIHRRSYTCPECHKVCRNRTGLTQHRLAQHTHLTPPPPSDTLLEDEDNQINYERHPLLSGRPCHENGVFRHPDAPPPPPPPVPPPTDCDSWLPFEDRLTFDFADYHFVQVQSSAAGINKALDMWAAAVWKRGGDIPWANEQEMYECIDSIQEQYNPSGKRVYSNLMSADWAWQQSDIIGQDPATHGAMFFPVVCGSDKTTVSVATGHQEYHPVYQSPGNITNAARRGHGSSVLPSALLPIPKTSKKHREKPEFRSFCGQLYHACLARIFEPLRAGMTTPDTIKCPDGHFRRAVNGIGPYIADYAEQVWLAGIVQGWCPKCDATPDKLDETPHTHLRSRTTREFMITIFDPGTLWDDYGVRSDITVFTHQFPHADIHEVMSPDLLHQLIKGTFFDHLVKFTNDYLYKAYPKEEANRIIQDIDRRISAVPAFPGLRRFPDGWDFNQWTGDDSKALMKVYIAAIQGHVPSDIVKTFSAFMECCFIVRKNSLTADDFAAFDYHLSRFHEYREIFITTGVRDDLSLPRQHALKHYPRGLRTFGSPNGLCSSITESKHIKAVKEPWRRSS
ncbi:hypothetical protein PM082_022988 [Marasmius tenuissimus]|nr:hypothetical protein PM082_022967 [Marasmius tenuissimus]KAJ8095663.1 hypothetical protein PM082_022988 [Marasmius tenuissimus]